MICFFVRRGYQSLLSQPKPTFRLQYPRANLHQSSYELTRPNLKLKLGTRVIYQGFTGRQATANARQSLEYGTNIVGGVTPGKNAEHLGLPVLPTVRAAQEQLRPDATAVFVSAEHAGKAIEEAIEAEIPLIVAVAEHVPIHDLLRIHCILKTQSKSRLVGANCPGIISPRARCRIGFQPLPCFASGTVGIAAKSGTLSYETVASTTRAGLGQSLVIGIGGDVLAGTNFIDALQVFEKDDDTEAIVLVGEIGGRAEEDAAEWIKDYKQRASNPKPIVALVGGFRAAPGRVMGHAGAFVGPGEADAAAKVRALEQVGVSVVDHPAKFGNVVKKLLSGSPTRPKSSHSALNETRSGFHTLTAFSRDRRRSRWYKTQFLARGLWLKPDQATDMLHELGLPLKKHTSGSSDQMLLAVSIDRSHKCPCIVASNSGNSARSQSFPFDYLSGIDSELVQNVADYLGLKPSPRATVDSLEALLRNLFKLFVEKEAFLLETTIEIDSQSRLVITSTKFGFDDAAYKSSKRQEVVHRLRSVNDEIPQEVEAERHGIVYIKLDGDGNIGTLVNGAGLAMNTNDALAALGGRNANFLDTGGKATSETVKTSFKLILQDERVKVIFVNIFGGLTLCDMIAEGILLAFKELQMSVPVVVRLRGTNEEVGQKIIAESGLPLFAFDDFDEAARRAIALADER